MYNKGGFTGNTRHESDTTGWVLFGVILGRNGVFNLHELAYFCHDDQDDLGTHRKGVEDWRGIEKKDWHRA